MDASPPLPNPQGNQKIWSMLCHLSGFLGVGLILPLVVFLAMRRESDYVANNARSALNFHLSMLIYAICCVPLIFIVIGIPLMVILGLLTLVFSIIATLRASEGGCYHYPIALPLVK